MEDYAFSIQYHLREANVVADALSQNPHGILASLALEGWKRATTIEGYDQ